MRRLTLVLLCCVLFIGGGLVGMFATMRMQRPETIPVVVGSGNGLSTAKQVSFIGGFVPVAKRVLPAVVSITSSKIVRPKSQASPFFSDPFFRQFFGNQFGGTTPRPQWEESLGSGTIVSPDGLIITNNHVIADASEVKVVLWDKTAATGKIIGTDPQTDIALVKVDRKDLPVVPMGDSSKVQVGDFALAFGNPFAVGETVTMGIISATGRGGLNIESYEDFLQTDAAINPGNSGGTLADVFGNLIGVNTAILTGSGGGNQGVGFAIPVNMVRQVMDQILKNGRVIRSYLGVRVQSLGPELARAFGVSGPPHGAVITDVVPGGPAARAGLETGDVLLSLNGQPVEDSRSLSLRVSMLPPGTQVQVTYVRNGQQRTVTVPVAEAPAQPPAKPQAPATPRGELGLTVGPLTPDIANELQLPSGTRGVVVLQVDPLSPAALAGIEKGDVIQAVDGRPVNNIGDLRQAMRAAGNKPPLVLIDRKGEHAYTVIQSQ